MMMREKRDYEDKRKRVEKSWKRAGGIDERNNFTEKDSYRFFFGY